MSNTELEEQEGEQLSTDELKAQIAELKTRKKELGPIERGELRSKEAELKARELKEEGNIHQAKFVSQREEVHQKLLRQSLLETGQEQLEPGEKNPLFWGYDAVREMQRVKEEWDGAVAEAKDIIMKSTNSTKTPDYKTIAKYFEVKAKELEEKYGKNEKWGKEWDKDDEGNTRWSFKKEYRRSTGMTYELYKSIQNYYEMVASTQESYVSKVKGILQRKQSLEAERSKLEMDHLLRAYETPEAEEDERQEEATAHEQDPEYQKRMTEIKEALQEIDTDLQKAKEGRDKSIEVDHDYYFVEPRVTRMTHRRNNYDGEMNRSLHEFLGTFHDRYSRKNYNDPDLLLTADPRHPTRLHAKDDASKERLLDEAMKLATEKFQLGKRDDWGNREKLSEYKVSEKIKDKLKFSTRRDTKEGQEEREYKYLSPFTVELLKNNEGNQDLLSSIFDDTKFVEYLIYKKSEGLELLKELIKVAQEKYPSNHESIIMPGLAESFWIKVDKSTRHMSNNKNPAYFKILATSYFLEVESTCNKLGYDYSNYNHFLDVGFMDDEDIKKALSFEKIPGGMIFATHYHDSKKPETDSTENLRPVNKYIEEGSKILGREKFLEHLLSTFLSPDKSSDKIEDIVIQKMVNIMSGSARTENETEVLIPEIKKDFIKKVFELLKNKGYTYKELLLAIKKVDSTDQPALTESLFVAFMHEIMSGEVNPKETSGSGTNARKIRDAQKPKSKGR